MLTTVAERFTTIDQFTKYQKFLDDKKTDLGDAYDSLGASLTTAKTNLDWDNKYGKEFFDHLIKLKNSASIKSISTIVSVISAAILWMSY